VKTRSVAAGFGRHGMPSPASNDTGTALGQDGSDWSRDLATLTFDLETGMRVVSMVGNGNLHSEFGHAIAFGFSSYSLCTRRTDGQTKRMDGQTKATLNRRGHNNASGAENRHRIDAELCVSSAGLAHSPLSAHLDACLCMRCFALADEWFGYFYASANCGP